MKAEEPKAKSVHCQLMVAGSERMVAAMSQVKIAPRRMPMIPPTAVRTTASMVNCSSTSWRRAPTALRTPISRVRSVTETSIMFMTPTPPTSRATLLTANMKTKTPPVTWFHKSIIESAVKISKLSG